MRLAWVALLLTGCSNILGIEDLAREGRDAGADTAPEKFTFSSPACESCSAQCSAELAACASDSACAAVFRELAKCAPDDSICRAKSGLLNPDAYRGDKLLAVESCRRVHCVPDCYTGIGYARFHPKCQCLDERCAKEISACVRSSVTTGDAGVADGGASPGGAAVGDCERVIGCALASNTLDPDQAYACLFQNPGGDPESDRLHACMASASCAECPLAGGRNYQCAGNYSWRPPPRSSFDFEISSSQATSPTKRVPDVNVRVCGELGCGNCLAKGGEGNTGDAGSLTVPLEGAFVREPLCIRLQKEGFADSTGHLGRPAYATTGNRFNVGIGTPTEIAGVGDLLKVSVNPEDAFVIVSAFDCVFNPGAGLMFEPVGGVAPITFTQLGPAPGVPTDSRGQVVYANVRPGLHNIAAKYDGKVVAERQFELTPGLNWVLLVPTSR